jgi:hypothetical protein
MVNAVFVASFFARRKFMRESGDALKLRSNMVGVWRHRTAARCADPAPQVCPSRPADAYWDIRRPAHLIAQRQQQRYAAPLPHRHLGVGDGRWV